jgi:hypothetical protein
MSKQLINMCTYIVKTGKEAEFEKLLAQHWPTLRRTGLSTDDPPQIYRGIVDKRAKEFNGNTFYVEIFTWKDEKGPSRAHEMPDIMAVWEPMGPLLEHMQFPMVEAIDLPR